MRRQLFCSTQCARDADRLAAWRRVRAQLSRPVPARAAVLAVALAASAPMILALRTVRDLDRLNGLAPMARTNRASRAALESIVETPKGARLEGTAPEGAAVFLFAGGRFVATSPSEAGRFRFEGVSVPGPYRVGALPLSEERPLAAGPPLPADLRSPPDLRSPRRSRRCPRRRRRRDLPLLGSGSPSRRSLLPLREGGSAPPI